MLPTPLPDSRGTQRFTAPKGRQPMSAAAGQEKNVVSEVGTFLLSVLGVFHGFSEVCFHL